MCYERYWRRRDADESRAIWSEFETTRPIADPSRDEVTEPEATEPREPAETAAER